jgi:hypothetical protein
MMNISHWSPGRVRAVKAGIGFVVLLVLLVSAVWWCGPQHGNSREQRINIVSSLKQVGLAFVGKRNDIARFTATGDAAKTADGAREK